MAQRWKIDIDCRCVQTRPHYRDYQAGWSESLRVHYRLGAEHPPRTRAAGVRSGRVTPLHALRNRDPKAKLINAVLVGEFGDRTVRPLIAVNGRRDAWAIIVRTRPRNPHMRHLPAGVKTCCSTSARRCRPATTWRSSVALKLKLKLSSVCAQTADHEGHLQAHAHADDDETCRHHCCRDSRCVERIFHSREASMTKAHATSESLPHSLPISKRIPAASAPRQLLHSQEPFCAA